VFLLIVIKLITAIKLYKQRSGLPRDEVMRRANTVQQMLNEWSKHIQLFVKVLQEFITWYQNKVSSKNVGEQIMCAVCGKVLQGAYVKVGEAGYHQGCFNCTKCKAPIQGKFFNLNGLPHCEKCTSEAEAGREKCSKCGKVITGQFIKALGKDWHYDCFTCTKCGKLLAGKILTLNGQPFCENCV